MKLQSRFCFFLVCALLTPALATRALAADTPECQALKHSYKLKRAERLGTVKADVREVRSVLALTAGFVSGRSGLWSSAYRQEAKTLRDLPSDRPDLAEPSIDVVKSRVLNSIRKNDPQFRQTVMIIPNGQRSESAHYYSEITTDFASLARAPTVRACVFNNTSWTDPVPPASKNPPVACVELDLRSGKMRGQALQSAVALADEEARGDEARRDGQRKFAAELAESRLSADEWIDARMTEADHVLCHDIPAPREEEKRDVKRTEPEGHAEGHDGDAERTRPIVHGVIDLH